MNAVKSVLSSKNPLKAESKYEKSHSWGLRYLSSISDAIGISDRNRITSGSCWCTEGGNDCSVVHHPLRAGVSIEIPELGCEVPIEHLNFQ